MTAVLIEKIKDTVSNKEGKKVRESNFELLRIVSMFGIILHHLATHSGVLSRLAINCNRCVTVFINMFGKMGVVCFILISGYFMVNSKFKIKKLISLYVEMMFYSIVIFLIFLKLNLIDYSDDFLKKTLYPVTSETYWFMGSYILLYIISPLLNKIINKSTKSQFQKIIVVFVIIFSIIPFIMRYEIGTILELGYFSCIYFIGAYIRKYDVQIDRKILIKGLLIILAVLVSITFYCAFRATRNPILILWMFYFEELHCVFVLFLAIFIFLIFRTIKLKSAVINLLAENCFAVYLLHDNFFVRNIIWKDVFHIKELYQMNPIIYILSIILIPFIIYIVGISIEALRRKLFGFIGKLFNRLKKKSGNVIDIQ